MSEIKYLSVEEWQIACKQGAYLTVRIPLMGHSMMPLVRKAKDLVTIAPLQRPLKRGDIVLFQRGDGAYVVHRVYRLQEDRVVTLGDGCLWPDRPMHQDSVCGLVIELERDGRHLHLNRRLWRCLGCIWMNCLPVRRAMFGLLRRLKRCIRQR